MSRRRTRFELGHKPAAALVAMVLAWAAPAGASPLEDPTAGGAVFSGPTHAHASSIFLNPAALGFAGRGLHLHLGGSLRLDRLSIDRRTVDPENGQLGDGPSVSTTTWSPGGMLAVYSTVLQERAVFGAALHTTTFDRFPAGKGALGYHVLGGHVYQSLLSLAGCFRLTDNIMFGLGVSIGYAGMELDLARDTALEAGGGAERGIASDCGGQACGFENPEATETIHLATSTGGLNGLFARENLGASLGLAVEVRSDWWVTMSMVSPPGAIPQRDYELALQGDAVVESAPRDGGDRHRGRGEITFAMPYSVWLGVRGPLLPGYDLVTSARWQNLSRHDVYDIRLYGGDLTDAGVPEWYPRYRGLRDVWQASFGLEGQEAGRTRFGGRLRVESGATTARNVSPLQVDGLDLGAAGGVELRVSQHVVFQLGYDLSWFPEVSSSDSAFDPMARLACVDSDFAFQRCGAARDGRAVPTAAGNYGRMRHAMSLSLRYDSL
jgi:long-subunit fatty acid transport protein